MSTYDRISCWYISFLEKRTRNFFEVLFYFFLYVLSLLYGIIIGARNRFYEAGICSVHTSIRPVISIGNISWAGSGKTTLTVHLAGKLAEKYRVAVLRRGYGFDEGKLLAEKGISAYSSRDRVGLSNQLCDSFDLFILDDGFQYRRLHRDVNIVLMATREFALPQRLIPASVFREPLRALGRADILILNSIGEEDNGAVIKERLGREFANLSIYYASYQFSGFSDTVGQKVELAQLQNGRVSAFAAIGHPSGFFAMLARAGIKVHSKLIYPDHYELSKAESSAIEEKLMREGVEYLCITHKDKFHFPDTFPRVRRVIAHITMNIEHEEMFLSDVRGRLKATREQCID